MTDLSPLGVRTIVVLGRKRLDPLEPARCVSRAGTHGGQLLVFSIGYPPTDRQRAFVAEVIDRAFELRVRVDAEMIPGLSKLPAFRPDDDVLIVAAGREERRIDGALAHQPLLSAGERRS